MYEEVKLMELARRAYELEAGERIDFAMGDSYDAEIYGGWCGILRERDCFDTDDMYYLIGHYGSYASTKMYRLDEYDPRIGSSFSTLCKKVDYPTDKELIAVLAKAIADYCDLEFGGVSYCETYTIDVEE